MRARLILSAVCGLLVASQTLRAQDRYINANGVRLRYIEQGTGEPVVLVHGFGNSIETWTNSGIVQALASSYRVITFDERGHGRSNKPHDPRAYGREMTDDIVRVLDRLGIDRAHVVGYSLGGHLVSQLLTLHPERFLSATLIAGAGRLSWDSVQAHAAEVEATEVERDCVSRTLLFRLTSPAARPSEDSLKAMSARCLADSTQDRFALAAITRSRAGQVIAPAAAAAVRVPTLGIVGSDDPMRAGLEELVRLRPSVKLVVVDGATHAGARGILRWPETTAALREFLALARRTSRATPASAERQLAALPAPSIVSTLDSCPSPTR
jgi:pimeloyl-ACP methyl ester carboxylesterase